MTNTYIFHPKPSDLFPKIPRDYFDHAGDYVEIIHERPYLNVVTIQSLTTNWRGVVTPDELIPFPLEN
ncbi:hypothetical protein [Methylocystis sp. ATCC 49242]|uniref:hypothetical protein n=1 Tax=Methylocystis sp. ATCC 49242 TaxID=622637 RepID=UPI0001F870FA|nr:hypothetical protein [Methylocystis sp. ATCC 49242]